ncbi:MULTISPECIES: response regulator [Nonomuraea]|uniref:Response regulator transcription factor n=1 Tax=Nonomuraea ferruginea TaxID=46174 RepID=A0ABT4T9C7_9ACTN|nr:response regulator transcription factor [Nonomuraea ferruginea]MDA0646111.1 response regulator transcription factor [Nonomuraea ferruginea]
MSPSQGPHPPAPVRLLLVEDHDMVAEAIAMALDHDPGIKVVARSRSVAAAVADARAHLPDVVVLDRRLPDGDGITAIGRISQAAPGARVLVLTAEATPAIAVRVVEAGGAGLVVKSSGLRELESAVIEVASGGVAFGPGLLPAVLDQLAGRGRAGRGALTGRERETLHLLAEGVSTDQLSERLGIARNTARNHIQRVLEKLGARSKLEAVAIARREGLLD